MLACVSHLQDVLKGPLASLLLFFQVHLSTMLELMCSGQEGGHSTDLLLPMCFDHHGPEVAHLISQRPRSVGLKHLCSQVLLILSHDLPAVTNCGIKQRMSQADSSRHCEKQEMQQQFCHNITVLVRLREVQSTHQVRSPLNQHGRCAAYTMDQCIPTYTVYQSTVVCVCI